MSINIRVREAFLLLPRTIGSTRKWLIRAKWSEQLEFYSNHTQEWVAQKWLGKK